MLSINQIKKRTIRSSVPQTMSRRLFLYTFVLFLLIGSILAGCLLLSGRFLSVERDTASMLATQLSIYEQNIAAHFDHTAARGLYLSSELNEQIEAWLEQNNLMFDDLSGNSNAITELEADLYSTLKQSLELTDCSGAYFMLNTTVNPTLPNADRSKSGLYLKIANLNVMHPINMKLLLYRGTTEIGNMNNLEYHNMWSLEYDVDNFPNYNLIMSMANEDLNSCYLFTDSIKLPGTWENIMLLCVPIISKNGDIYGICGFEISQLFYKLYYEKSNTSPHITGLLTMTNTNGISIDSGLISGAQRESSSNLTGSLAVSKGPGFLIFHSEKEKFVGLIKSLKLSPLRGEHTLAVMIPAENYKALKWRNIQEVSVIIVLLILVTVLGSIQMSKLYVRPILAGLSKVRSQDSGDMTNIREIDDLLEYLTQKDAQIESIAKVKNEKPQTTFALYEEFVNNIETLSPAERSVFNLYMKGHTANEITKILFLSINTIKTHNKRIYMKLQVNSLKELMVYVNMMKERGETRV